MSPVSVCRRLQMRRVPDHQARAATMPLAEARMDERTRRETFRYLLRKRIAAILRARSPTLSAEAAPPRSANCTPWRCTF